MNILELGSFGVLGRPGVHKLSDGASAIASNALYWWDATNAENFRSGIDGSDGVPATTDKLGLWIDIAGQGGRTGTQAIAAQTELITNGTFDSDVSGWTATAGTMTYNAGRALLVDGAAVGSVRAGTSLGSLTAGTVVQFTTDIQFGTASAIYLRLSTDATNFTNNVGLQSSAFSGTSGTVFFTIPSTATYYAVLVGSGTSGETVYFDNVSVKELPGVTGFSPAVSEQPDWNSGGYVDITGATEAVDFELSGGFGSDVDVWFVVDTTDTQGMLFHTSSLSYFGLATQSGGGDPPTTGIGSPSVFVGDSAALTTRGALYTALSSGKALAYMTNANLSNPGDFSIGQNAYSGGWGLTGKIYGVAISNPANRAAIKAAIGAYYGVTV